MEDSKQEPTLLWEDASPSNITSTIWISNDSKNDCVINVFVNDKFLFSILNGRSKSVTIAKLQSLSITTDSKQGIKGKFYMVINKKVTYLNGEKKDIKGN
ncbi:S-Ena type endospore appendage [Peribacillus sp. JNUCC 23]